MILGVGVDIVDVHRMERALRCRWGTRFIARVFSEEEIAVCSSAPQPSQGYAARFAAKEALAKALGTGFSRGVSPRRIVVRGGERRQPRIALLGRAQELAASMHVSAIHVSLSHTPQTACAMVVLEKEDT
ncbi:MAG: holo-ACP synthase [Desulfomonilaceae bacterium]